jgi:cytochrome c biogenesis factor
VADLGRAALIVAFGLALYAVIAGSVAAHDGRRRLHESARNAIVGAFAAATAIAAALGAANFGTALAFGQIGFAAALVWVLLRR